MATPSTVNTWPLNGSVQEFDVTFDYLSQTFIKVNLVGPTGLTPLVLGMDFTFVTPTRIRTALVYGPPVFTTIELRRETSTTERLVEFQDASILHATDLNTDALQVMHVAEEARNAATETIGVNGDGNLDARSRRIVNVAEPQGPADAITLNYYTSQVTGVHTDRLAAEAARNKAQEWATKPTAVEGTDQSAKTYAGQSSTSAGTASAQAGIATNQASNAAGSASSAAGSAGAAAAARVLATNQAGIATTQAGISSAQAGIATAKATEAAASAQSVDTTYLRARPNHTGPLNWAWATYGGTADTVTLDPAFARTAYVAGDEFRFRATAANTGATTINVGGLGAKAAVTVLGTALPAGYIRTGVDTVCVYDGTQFVVQRDMERGSNTNGTYVKYADGTLECYGKILMPAHALSAQVDIIWMHPSRFSEIPTSSFLPLTASGTASQEPVGILNRNGVWLAGQTTWATSMSAYGYVAARPFPVLLSVSAKGAWY